jgi:hypothetical protein
MTYIQIATLVGDSTFTNRITACCTEQAGVFINDQRPEYVDLARTIINNAETAQWFYWLAATSPGFAESDDITDQMILAAIQSLWPVVSAAHPEIASA